MKCIVRFENSHQNTYHFIGIFRNICPWRWWRIDYFSFREIVRWFTSVYSEKLSFQRLFHPWHNFVFGVRYSSLFGGIFFDKKNCK